MKVTGNTGTNDDHREENVNLTRKYHEVLDWKKLNNLKYSLCGLSHVDSETSVCAVIRAASPMEGQTFRHPGYTSLLSRQEL
jgi:hypothetical protein